MTEARSGGGRARGKRGGRRGRGGGGGPPRGDAPTTASQPRGEAGARAHHRHSNPRAGSHGGRAPARGPPGRSRTAPPERTPPKKDGDKGAEAHTVSEEYRLQLTRALLDLREADDEQLALPAGLTNTQRKFVSAGEGCRPRACITRASLKVDVSQQASLSASTVTSQRGS